MIQATGPHLEPVETLQSGVPPLRPVLERLGVGGQLPLLLPVSRVGNKNPPKKTHLKKPIKNVFGLFFNF
jgi:hypothetical protein